MEPRGQGWIVRPIVFLAINLLASRVAASRAQLAARNAELRAEVADHEHAEQELEAALQADRALESQLSARHR